MRAVVQRVLQAKVEVDDEIAGQIEKGLLVYLSVGEDDEEKDARFIAEKIANLRVFEDEAGKMNRSVRDTGGGILLISNFTLHGDCRKGRRPGFDAAAEPELAEQLYEKVKVMIADAGVVVETGRFGAHMHVSSINNGPVNFMLDSGRLF
ncbi:MAG: D-aminoacyl-tRNA deacylase [Planctomycetota bacterium]|jgi:D-tyrosyl-tRNA(Tyr) deacylase